MRTLGETRAVCLRPRAVRIRTTAQEGMMAKGMNRGNREPKKPKTKKPVAGPAASILSPKGISPSSNLPKKKD